MINKFAVPILLSPNVGISFFKSNAPYISFVVLVDTIVSLGIDIESGIISNGGTRAEREVIGTSTFSSKLANVVFVFNRATNCVRFCYYVRLFCYKFYCINLR